MRRVGIVVQARIGSTRLPGKVLKEVEGRPLITRVFERLKWVRQASLIVCAIPETPENIPLRELCMKFEIEVLAGPEEDVLKRYVMAADRLGLTDVVRITADCPLIDPCLVDEFVEKHLSGKWDLTANLTGVGGAFPRGMDVEVVTASTLRRINSGSLARRFREHVTLHIYENPSEFKIHIIPPLREQARPDLRLCVDEVPDLEVVRAVYRNFLPRTQFGLDDIIGFLDNHPEIATLNRHVRAKNI